MTHRTKTPFIQSIVPNLEDYIQDVQLFYNEKIELIMYKINQFIAVATELTEIPQHLALEFNEVKLFQKLSQQEKDWQRLMVRDEIEKFLNLKNEVIQYQTGAKYLYPNLPKIQRNLNKRKYSKSDSVSSDSDKYESPESKESLNQICNLLGTLNLQSQHSDQLCNSIQNIVVSMNGLTIKDPSEPQNSSINDNSHSPALQSSLPEFEHKIMQLQRIRKIKKVQLRRFEIYLSSNCENVGEQYFKENCAEKLSQIKQLFRAHLENSVTAVVKDIQNILSKALRDIKLHDKAYVPIHKISSFFNRLNLKFYRSEGVIKCLHKYLTKKVKECVMDGYQTFYKHGVQMQVKTNFRFRFFKHIILQNIFFMWLKQAVVDFNKIVNDDGSSQDSRMSDMSEKIQCEKETHIQQSQEEIPEIFLPPRTGHSFDNFIM